MNPQKSNDALEREDRIANLATFFFIKAIFRNCHTAFILPPSDLFAAEIRGGPLFI